MGLKIKQQLKILMALFKNTSLIGFLFSIQMILLRSIKQPGIFHGYCHLWFARVYKAKREIFYHKEWNQMGHEQFILKFSPGKLMVCSKLELEVFKKKGLISKSASIRKLTNRSL